MARPTASAPAAPARHSPAAPARHSLQPAHRGRDSDFALPPRSELRLRFFAEKPITGPAPKVREICCPRSITPGVFFPSPGQRRRSVSEAVLAASLTECFFHHSHAAVNPGVATGLPLQSCCGNRIASPNPAVATGLPLQSCCGNRIASPNPAVATGLRFQSCCGNRIASPNPAVATGLPLQSCCGNRIASPIPVLATGMPRCITSSSGLELFFPERRLVMESAPL